MRTPELEASALGMDCRVKAVYPIARASSFGVEMLIVGPWWDGMSESKMEII
ncbi:MAG: hypothetical protein HKL81_04155 [Acidimicrobiaceae bacterium]|nr:hypothetical protein [Acidimicrobiaceae bacterium]